MPSDCKALPSKTAAKVPALRLSQVRGVRASLSLCEAEIRSPHLVIVMQSSGERGQRSA